GVQSATGAPAGTSLVAPAGALIPCCSTVMTCVPITFTVTPMRSVTDPDAVTVWCPVCKLRTWRVTSVPPMNPPLFKSACSSKPDGGVYVAPLSDDAQRSSKLCAIGLLGGVSIDVLEPVNP